MKDLEKARELQADYVRGSEVWKYYQRQIDALEAEALKQQEDDRYRVRSWGSK
jgi:hypothetical protein